MVSYGCLLKKKILWFDLMVVHVDGCPVDGCPLTFEFGADISWKNWRLRTLDEGLNGKKVSKHAWYHCFMPREGVW